MNKKTKPYVLLPILVTLSVAAMIVVSSGEQMNIAVSGSSKLQKNYISDIQNRCVDINDNINEKIFNLPKVYTLPLDQSPAPEPDPDGFTEDSYEDSTISVQCWRERISVKDKTVTANFAEVKIAHPTQLRTAFAGGSFGTKRATATKMARSNNAVVAINGDFYNYHSDGLFIRNGAVFRELAYGADVLFIDSNGNFSVKTDRDAIKEGFYKKTKIYQSLSFGPALVVDGKVLNNGKANYSCGPFGNEPRTAIGQIGPLHYLLCTIDGRSKVSEGVTVAELASIMSKKKCIVAYNLDGGQSSVLYFHDKAYNHVADGGERTLSDIVYFATALPDSDRQ